MKGAKVRTLFFKLRFSILYFIYAFEIHRPNVNSVLQSSLNWNKTISVINVRYYAPIVHSTLSSATQPLYPIFCQHIPYQPRRAELGFVNENMSCPVLSCLPPQRRIYTSIKEINSISKQWTRSKGSDVSIIQNHYYLIL